MKKLWYHGTNKQNAENILKEGFRARTYYAAHLEDALAFGGHHVFTVAFDCDNEDWQVCLDNAIPKERIVGYRIYRVKEIFWQHTAIKEYFEETSCNVPEGLDER